MINQFSSRPLEDYVTVLAIYDDPPSSSQPSSSASYRRFGSSSNFRSEQRVKSSKSHRSISVAQNSPTIISVDSSDGQTSVHTVYVEPAANEVDVVEVTTLDEPPSCGLQVISNNNIFAVRTNMSANSSPIFLRKVTEEKSEKESRSVSMDPSPAHISFRSNARKSRFTDAFLDAKERLEQEFEQGANISAFSSGSSNFRYSKILLSSETVNVPTGIEVSAVPDPDKPNRIIAVEVVRMEDSGRVAEDGRMKVGDQITEINGHSCREMSLARARLYLRDLEQLPEPSLAFNRQIETVHTGESTEHPSSIIVKPIKTALQQGNTSKIGETLDLVVKKSNDGFGFSFAGRFNAMNEHLFYVKTIKSGGASCGILKIGDRLLKIDGKDLSSLQQSDVTALLKSKKSGDSIDILVSRVPEHLADEENHPIRTPETLKNTPSVTFKDEKETSGLELDQHLYSYLARKLGDTGCELVELHIALNDSPSAGLGISLKAQRIYNDGLASDSGLYIRSVLHGSAAYKDGRLRIDDRLVAIQDVNLLKYKLNGEALEAFIKCLSMMPTNAYSVKVFVARKKNEKGSETQTEFVINRTVIPPSKQDVEPSSTGQLKHRGIDESESDISVVQDDTDAFVRDTVTRKSISEKRPLGVHNDPSHLQTYQRIKHNRQTSAPAIDSLLRVSPSQTQAGYVKNRRRRSLGNSLAPHNNRMSIPPLETAHKMDNLVAKPQRPLTYYCQTSLTTKEDLKDRKFDFVEKKLATSASFTHAKEHLRTKKTSKFWGIFRSSGSKVSKEAKILYAVNVDTQEMIDQENLDSSPKRRSASIETFTAGRSFDSRAKKEKKIVSPPVHRRIQSSALPKTGIPSSVSQPALGSAFKNYERAPISSISHLKEDKNKAQRRKSTGSGFLKFLHKVGPSASTADHFHVGDEKRDGVQYSTYNNQEDYDHRAQDYERREDMPPQAYPKNPYSSPQESRRRPPPPPYHGSPIYATTTYPYHQRVYSVQEPPHNYRQMDPHAYIQPKIQGAQERLPSTTTHYYSDATNYRPHPSTYPHQQWSCSPVNITTSLASHVNHPATTTTLLMPGLHTARPCRGASVLPPPFHHTTKAGGSLRQQLQGVHTLHQGQEMPLLAHLHGHKSPRREANQPVYTSPGYESFPFLPIFNRF
uniref:PDZ domain-containing protein n=1 Tax=Ditylenchus dipsaci TaxID=166011 RepID=A0A915CQJ3_9BILA